MKDILNMGITEVPLPMALQKLLKAKSKITRKKLLKKLWDNDDEEIFLGLELSIDNDINFGVTSVPIWDDADDGTIVLPFNEFYDFCMLVKFKKIDKSDIEKKILELANKSGTFEWNNFYRLILLKKLQSTLPVKEIVETLKEIQDETKNNKSDANIILKRK